MKIIKTDPKLSPFNIGRSHEDHLVELLLRHEPVPVHVRGLEAFPHEEVDLTTPRLARGHKLWSVTRILIEDI